jgi:hypothetical protein
VPDVGTNIFFIAPTVLRALATSIGIGLGTLNIHHNKITMDAVKIIANRAPRRLI